MPQGKRVVTCELDEYHSGVLTRAKKHGYQTKSEAVRAGLRLLDEDLSRKSEETLSPRAGGASLKDQLENHECLRGTACKSEV